MTTALWIALCASGLIVGFVGGFGYRRRSQTPRAAGERELELELESAAVQAPEADAKAQVGVGVGVGVGGAAPTEQRRRTHPANGSEPEVDNTTPRHQRGGTHPANGADVGRGADDVGRVVASADFAAQRVPEPAGAPVEHHEAAVIDLRPPPTSSRPARPTRPGAEVRRRNGAGGVESATSAGSADAERPDAMIIDLRNRASAAVPVHNLQFVRGIGPDLDLELRRHGIVTLADLVALDDARVDELDESLVAFRAKRVRRKLQPRAADMLEAAAVAGVAEAPDTTALRQVQGIGSTMARWLETQEILTLEQLAALDDDDVAELQAELPHFPGRIVQQRWVEQARHLLAQPIESP